MNANEIRKEISDSMVKALQDGITPWRKPWAGGENVGNPCNFVSKRRYTGINHILLSWSSILTGFESQHWGTAVSWMKTLGAHVKRGEKATAVTFFRMLPKRDPETKAVEVNSNGDQLMIPLLKKFAVFNVSQIQAPASSVLLDGRCGKGRSSIVKALLDQSDRKARTSFTTLDELKKIAAIHSPALSANTKEEWAQGIADAIDAKIAKYRVIIETRNRDPDFDPAEQLIESTKADITYGGTRACHSMGKIKVPKRQHFDSIAAFYETVFHELGHWAVPQMNSLKKEFANKEDSYAFEELVVEIAASYLMAEMGVPLADEMLGNSKSYVVNWVGKMQSDPKYIFEASTYASQVADFLLKFVGKENPSYNDDATADQSVAA